VGTPSAANDAGASQAEQDLFDVVARKLLRLGDLAARDRAFRRATGEMEGTERCIRFRNRTCRARNLDRSCAMADG